MMFFHSQQSLFSILHQKKSNPNIHIESDQSTITLTTTKDVPIDIKGAYENTYLDAYGTLPKTKETMAQTTGSK